MTNPDLHDTHARNWHEAQAACARDTHARIRRQGRVDGQRDIERAARRAYRAGQRNGATVALVACLGLAMAAAWLAWRRGRA